VVGGVADLGSLAAYPVYCFPTTVRAASSCRIKAISRELEMSHLLRLHRLDRRLELDHWLRCIPRAYAGRRSIMR